MKTSIRSKINKLIIASIAILSIVMVCINLVIISRYTEKDSETMMENTCSAKELELNNQFQLVEQSVQNIYDISEAMRPSVDELRTYEKTEKYIREFQAMAIAIADNTEGAITVYYRINPELNVNGVQGFFYVKSPDSGEFEPHEITDLLAYDKNDVEHVGWYYIPVQEGRPVWMEPYYNANIDVEMISYVVPVFEGQNLIGVVGMDVDFGRLIHITEDIHIYRSSGAVLASMENGQVYYRNCGIFGGKLSEELHHILQRADASPKIFSSNTDGDSYCIYYKTLQNRMKLIVYAKKSDIFEQANLFVFVSGIVFAVSILFTLMIAVRTTKRIMVPIENISEATKQYAQGNWDVKVDCDTDDELKVLTDNITIMAENTKQYIDYIKDMAKKDALTGLRNKTAYMLYVEKINSEYIAKRKKFAIVVFDVNNLKVINDNYGHEKGDELIVDASKAICSEYAHSPVFRVGGDEFVAILDADDYPRRDEILADFRSHMRLKKDSTDTFEVCIASGMAVFGESGESFDELFVAADRQMYQNKRELKESL